MLERERKKKIRIPIRKLNSPISAAVVSILLERIELHCVSQGLVEIGNVSETHSEEHCLEGESGVWLIV